jgi:3'-phosphoadenosine 5'-phosphosulfate sulfotransferase
MNSRITSTTLRQRIMRNIELIREGTQLLVVCEFSLRNGTRRRWRKSCVYDIYLVWGVGINKERTKSGGEGKRVLPP